MYVEFTVPTTTAVTNNEPTGFGPAPTHMQTGDACQVKAIKMEGSRTLLQLEEDGRWYNSVHFTLDMTRFAIIYQELMGMQQDMRPVKLIRPGG